MATLPRYETMGVQYADLPRVSVAPQQAAMEGFSRMSQSLDRMVSFIQSESETRAQREAKKYAVENPLTKETIDRAMRGEPLPKIEGAGEIFQQTYEATQGALLASQLQAEGDRIISTALARIKEGAPVNLDQTRADLKDMIDGYATAVSAFSPEQSIKLRAALSMSGNNLFETAAQVSQKQQREALEADILSAASLSAPLIESVFSTKAGKIDPATGKPYDTVQILDVMARPFMDFAKTPGGSTKPLDKFRELVDQARVNAMVELATQPEFAANPIEAMNKVRKGDFGDLAGEHKFNLTQDQKDAVRKRVRDFYNDQQIDENLRRAEDERAKKTAANALQLELLGKPTPARTREIVSDLVRSGEWSVQTAQEYLKPPESKGNVVELLNVKDLIKRGAITSTPQLIAGYRNRLSDEQLKEAGNYLLNEAYRSADDALSRASGIIGFSINPGEDKINKRVALNGPFQENLRKGMSPIDAANEAIKQYDGDRTNQQKAAAREASRKAIEEALKVKGFAMPLVPVEQMDLGALRDGRGRPLDEPTRKAVQEQIERYRGTMQ